MRTGAALTGLAALTLLDISASSAQAQSFAGAYAGVHAGVRWDNGSVSDPSYLDKFNDNVPALNYSFSSASALAGGHLGYNALLTPGFLVGVEADFDFARNSHSGSSSSTISDCYDGCTIATSSDLVMGDQGTVRLRAGVVTGATLIFATGGLAYADVSWTNTLVDGTPISVSNDQVRAGWVVGGGFETFVSKNLIFRTEYLHEDFGSFSEPLADTTSVGNVNLKADKVRVGLSVKF